MEVNVQQQWKQRGRWCCRGWPPGPPCRRSWRRRTLHSVKIHIKHSYDIVCMLQCYLWKSSLFYKPFREKYNIESINKVFFIRRKWILFQEHKDILRRTSHMSSSNRMTPKKTVLMKSLTNDQSKKLTRCSYSLFLQVYLGSFMFCRNIVKSIFNRQMLLLTKV